MHVTAHGRTGDYKEFCKDCAEEYARGQRNGCTGHNNDPRVHRLGNVCNSPLVINTAEKLNKESTHKVDGAKQLLPSQLRAVGDYCISSNNHAELEVYALLVVAIYLFLQKLEFSSLKADNFNENMFVMNAPFIVQGLVDLSVSDTTVCQSSSASPTAACG